MGHKKTQYALQAFTKSMEKWATDLRDVFSQLAETFEMLQPKCDATEWVECPKHEGHAYVYRICNMTKGHKGRYHSEVDDGLLRASSSGDSGPITMPLCECNSKRRLAME